MSGLHISVPLAVPIGVENESGPALRFRRVSSFFEFLPVQPAHDAAATTAAEPQSIVCVLRELQMVCPKTCVDKRELLGVRIIHCRLAAGTFEREQFRRGIVRSCFAESRIARRPESGCKPHPPQFIEHRIVRIGLTVPDRLVSPIGRGHENGVIRGGGRVRIADGQLHLARCILRRIEDWREIRALLGRPVDQAVCVDGGISLVRGNLVMQVGCRGGPIPYQQDDIALDALRPWRRRRRQFTGGNPVRPIGKQRQGAIRVEPPDRIDHGAARLA